MSNGGAGPAIAQMRATKWWQRMGAGGLGGTALALLFLAKSNFLLGEPPLALLGGYLSAGSFVAMGLIVGLVLGEQVPMKIFVFGLMAPSVFSNALSQTEAGGDLGQIELPGLPTSLPGLNFTPSSATEVAPFPRVILVASQDPPIRKIDPGTVGNSVQSGAKKFLGRRSPAIRFAYVVAATADKDKALDFARYLNQAIPGVHRFGGAQILTIEGSRTNIVTIGGLVSREAAERLQKHLVNLAAMSQPSLVPYLLKGRVVDGKRLVSMR